MNIKRFAASAAAVFSFIFVFEWLFHGVLLQATYDRTAYLWRPKAECVFPAMLAGQLLLAVFFSYIFTRGYENKGIAEGTRYGFLIGLLFVPNNLIFYAVQPLPLDLVIKWIIGGMIEMTAAGAVLAAVYRPDR